MSALFNGWQMHVVDRMTKFMLAVAKKHERGGSVGTDLRGKGYGRNV